jgi:hypothetical protein
MSGFGCTEVRELAPEIAVNIVGGPERAEALQHMSECRPCRALVAELSEAADALTLLAAEAEPPSGFENRVLAAIGARRRPPWRRIAALVAAVVAATVIVTIVGVRFAERDDQRPIVAPASGDLRTEIQMRSTDSDAPVGAVQLSAGNPAVVVIRVNYYGMHDGTYTIRVRSEDAPRTIGHLTVHDGVGTWGGTASLPRDGIIALVGAGNREYCHARLPTLTED